MRCIGNDGSDGSDDVAGTCICTRIRFPVQAHGLGAMDALAQPGQIRIADQDAAVAVG